MDVNLASGEGGIGRGGERMRREGGKGMRRRRRRRRRREG